MTRKFVKLNFYIRSIFALICVLLGIAGMGTAYATSTGFLNPGTCSNVDSGGPTWGNTTNARTSNDSYATVSVDGTTSDYLQCVGYGFSIPAGATINGITVNVERKSNRTTNSGSRDAAVQLVKANVIATTNRATTTIYTTADVVEAHGGSSDLWGNTWTQADINNANFGVAFEATKPLSTGAAHTISVDAIQIAVEYTPDTTAPTVVSINRADTSPTSALSVNWTVTFSEAVTGVTAANFTLLPSGLSGTPAITSVTGSGSVWTVTATRGSGSGTLGLNMTSATGVIDVASNQLTGLTAVGQLYTIDPTAASQCYSDDFNRADGSPGSDWVVGLGGVSSFTPKIVNQSLRLTDNSQSASTYATLQKIFPGTGNKIVIEFTEYSYSGSAADGMGVVLSDASKPLAAGAFGGSLGYAPKQVSQGGDTTHEGFAGGWLGVGLDEFGSFSNPTEGRTGGPGLTADSIAIRGSGSGYTGYSYLRGTGTLSPGIDNAASASQAPGYRYRIIVDHSDSVHAWTSVERDTTGTGNSYSFMVPVFDAKTYAGQAAVPTNWLLSYTGATGSNANIHEIDSLRVCSITQQTPTLDHIQLEYPTTNCGSGTVVVKACADTACTTLYSGAVSLTLSENGANTSFTGGNALSFTGGQTAVVLARTSGTGSVTIGAGTISPTPTNATTCLSDSGTTNCSTNFVSACFDAVESTSSTPATPIYTKLAGASSVLKILAINNGAVNTSFSNATQVAVALVDASVASNCSSTTTGTALQNVTLSPTSPMTLVSGVRSVTFTYPNVAARNVKVRMTSGGVSTCSTDNFAIRPSSFTVLTSATSQPTAAIPTDNWIAGKDFSLTANTSVTSGYDGTPALDISQVSTNPVMAVIPLSGSFPQADGIKSVGTFQYQEVGVPAFSQDAVIDSSFAAVDQVSGVVNGVDHGGSLDCNSGTSSGNSRGGCTIGSALVTAIGRFRPDHFALSSGQISTRSDLSCSTASTFTYMGEPIAASFTLTAQNFGNTTTTNYAGTWAKLNPAAVVTAGVNPLGLGAVDSASPRTPFAACTATPAHPCVMANTATGNFVAGVANITLPFYAYRDTAATAGPYSLLDVGVAPTDSDGVQMAAFDLDTVNVVAGTSNHIKVGRTDVRYGRLKLANVNGSELLNATVQATTEYWKNGIGFVTNTDDSCTVIGASAIKLQNQLLGLNATNMPATNFIASPLSFVSGRSSIIVKKPLTTPTAKGSVDVCVDLASDNTPGTVCTATSASIPWLQGKWNGTLYDDDPGARVTLGVFRSGKVIYLRELY